MKGAVSRRLTENCVREANIRSKRDFWALVYFVHFTCGEIQSSVTASPCHLLSKGGFSACGRGALLSLPDSGSEVVLGGFGPADEADGAVLLKEELSGAQPAVVLVAHSVAVGAGVVDDQQVADLNLG